MSKKGSNGIIVHLPNGENIQSTHRALLNIKNIPIEAKICYIFPKLKGKTLILVGQFCDQGFTAVFAKKYARIEKYGIVYLRGNKYHAT